MSAEQFMKQHHLDVYFKDVAISGYQQEVDEEHLDAFKAQYYHNAALGSHVIGRDYAFVTSVDLTPHVNTSNERSITHLNTPQAPNTTACASVAMHEGLSSNVNLLGS